VIRTTWEDMTRAGHIESIGQRQYRLTAKGWLVGLAIAGLVPSDEYEARLGRLFAAMKSHVKPREESAIVTLGLRPPETVLIDERHRLSSGPMGPLRSMPADFPKVSLRRMVLASCSGFLRRTTICATRDSGRLCSSAVAQWRWRSGLYLNTFRAFFRVNRQLIFVRFWLALRFQALVSCRNFCRSGIRRFPRHCRAYRLSSISA